MLRIGLALLLLTAPAMAQVAAGTAPAVGGSGNQPAPDVSSEKSAAPSQHPAVKRPAHNSATKAARARHSDDTTR